MNVCTLTQKKMTLVLVFFSSVFTNIDCISFCCLHQFLCYFVSRVMYVPALEIGITEPVPCYVQSLQHVLCSVCCIGARWGHWGLF